MERHERERSEKDNMTDWTVSQHIVLSPIRLAVLDACEHYNFGQIITRINVPRDCRGYGIGRELLERCCRAADEHNIRLYLQVACYPDSPMDNPTLFKWYQRHGFHGNYAMMIQPSQKPST